MNSQLPSAIAKSAGGGDAGPAPSSAIAGPWLGGDPMGPTTAACNVDVDVCRARRTRKYRLRPARRTATSAEPCTPVALGPVKAERG
jgi:hypothetical protein